jgi:membrane protease YdiL (CAAX protease family)
MVLAVIVIGAAAQVAAWWLVASGRGSVWTTVGAVNVVTAAVAVAIRPPVASGDVGVAPALVVGVATGVALYGATALFVALVARRWPAFTRDAASIYSNRDERTPVLQLGVAGVVALAEELFWRGVTQQELGRRFGDAALGAATTLAAYVVVDAFARNRAILAGALVGGAVWGALAWWTGGVLASALAHAIWTMLMLARPVVGRPR